MKKKILEVIPIVCIFLFAGIFFRQTLFQGKLPVPSDTLVGMYHPWLDYIAKEYPAGMPFRNFLITDPVRQQIPWRKLAVESIRKGDFQPWNPYSFSGTPLATNIQTGLFYPLNLLFLFLSFPVAWTVLIMLQPILSGIFLYAFLKISIKISPLSSLFGALCFAFSGFSIVWLTWGTIGHTLLWLPLVLLLFDLLIRSKGRKRMILISTVLGIVLTAQYFAGHSQIFLYSSAFFIAYVLYRFVVQRQPAFWRKGYAIGLIGSILLCIILTSVHWIPFLSEAQQSSRLLYGSLFKEEGFFIPFQNLVQFIIPDFFGNPATLNYWGIWNYAEFSGYIGVAGLFFAIYAMFSKNIKSTLFWFIVIVISLLFALPNPVSAIPYVLRLPVFSSLQPTRLLSIIDIGLCVLAAIGFEAWMHTNRKKHTAISIGIILFCFGCIWYVVKFNPYGIPKEQLEVTARNIIFPSIICILVTAVVFMRTASETFLKRRNLIVSAAGAVIIIGVSFFDLSRFGWKFTPFTDPALFFPRTQIISYLQNQQKPFRIAALDDRIMPPNVNGYYGIESVAGYDPLYDRRYETFIAAMERGEPNITPPYGFKRIITPKNITSPLFRLLGVRYVLSLSDINDRRFNKVLQEGQTRLYEFADALPRAYLVEKIDYETGEQKTFEKLYSTSFQIGKSAIIERPLELISGPLSGTERVLISSYNNNRMDMTVDAAMPRLLLIGNLYHRGWRAYLDGKQVPILRVNYLFMAVVVPEGNHLVQILY